jgi:hypothetical protein
MKIISLTQHSYFLPLAFRLHLSGPKELHDMLRITTENKRSRIVLSVEGRLAGPWVSALEQCWRELYADSPGKKFSVNLCAVSFIDTAGKALLKEMHQLGGDLIAEGCLNQAIVKEIVGLQEKKKSPDGREPRGRKGSSILFYVLFLSLLCGAARLPAQTASSLLPPNAPATMLRLTLEQAVTLALRQNPTQQIAVINAAESVQDKNFTRADLLPQANFRAADSANRVNIRAEFGGGLGFPGIPGHIGPYQIFSAGPDFASSVFDLSLWKRYQASKSNVAAAKAQSLSTRESVILLVVSQYIGALRAAANVEASRSRVELAQALYDQAADLQKEGVGTGIDTLRANVELLCSA